MLRGIPEQISPELLKILAEMGHGDTIVIADAFYPAKSHSEQERCVYAKGITAPEMIDAILNLFPLDSEFSKNSVQYMVADHGNKDPMKIHQEVMEVVERYEYDPSVCVPIRRSAFYTVAEKAYATVSTSEEQPYGCFILQKGVK